MHRPLGFAAIVVSAIASFGIADIAVAQNTDNLSTSDLIMSIRRDANEQPVINFSIVRAAAS